MITHKHSAQGMLQGQVVGAPTGCAQGTPPRFVVGQARPRNHLVRVIVVCCLLFCVWVLVFSHVLCCCMLVLGAPAQPLEHRKRSSGSGCTVRGLHPSGSLSCIVPFRCAALDKHNRYNYFTTKRKRQTK